MCLTLLLQIHCTTISEHYSGKSGDNVRQLCDKMFEDSGIKNVQKLEAKLKYQECLQKNFASPIHQARTTSTVMIGILLNVFLNYIIIDGFK